ncbi:hypothetical protein NP233_g11336 [Leucocoprinus birnbaumii]|uniref:Uncharacterized protein n=1 Tax=Leucocoprinus birnbaumii TaxID=56174 RepID=A0AAD5YP26_9AGAR|nr:hypothetical protein NP233_g11336 [Leucocoprinus birnbaumii]
MPKDAAQKGSNRYSSLSQSQRHSQSAGRHNTSPSTSSKSESDELSDSESSSEKNSRSRQMPVSAHNPIQTFNRAVKKANGQKKIHHNGSLILKHLMRLAHWIARSLSPFVSFDNIWLIGLTFYAHENGLSCQTVVEDASVGLVISHSEGFTIDAENEDVQLCVEIFTRINEVIPHADTVCRSLLEKPSRRQALVKLMDKLRGNACSSDTHMLKTKGLEFAERVVPGGKFDPPINSQSPKETSWGFNHVQLGGFLVPAKDCKKYDKNPQAYIARINNGELLLTHDLLPSYLYKSGTCNAKKLYAGLFEGPIVIYVYKAIFTGTSSAASIDFIRTGTRICQAQKNGLWSVTPDSLAYACVHAHFMLSSAKEWRLDPPGFSKIKYFELLTKILHDGNEKWSKNLFGRLNVKIFGSHEGAPPPAPAPKKGASDADALLRQLNDESFDPDYNSDGMGGDSKGEIDELED